MRSQVTAFFRITRKFTLVSFLASLVQLSEPCNFGDQVICELNLVKKGPWSDKILFLQISYIGYSSYSINSRWPPSIFGLSPQLRISLYSGMIPLCIRLLICSFHFLGQIFVSRSFHRSNSFRVNIHIWYLLLYWTFWARIF